MAEQLAGVLLDNDETRLAAHLIRLGCAALEQRNGTVPAAAVALRDELAGFARRNSYDQVTAAAENAKPASGADEAGSSVLIGQIGVTEAAARLGVSAQTVRRMCRLGALTATRDSPAGAWLIDAWSVHDLAAQERESG